MPNPWASNVGSAFLLTADLGTSKAVTDAFQSFAMVVEVSDDLPAAKSWLGRRKFEAFVIDLSMGQDALAFHGLSRNSAANRRSVTFAITSDHNGTSEALKAGFNFALEKPLSMESIERTLRAAFGMIVRERRRNFRCPVTVPTVMSPKGTGETFFGETVNVSEGGFALRTQSVLVPGMEVSVEFTLPNPQQFSIKAQSRVCWRGDDGYAGLSFLFLPATVGSQLQTWLAERLESNLPEAVARKFSASS